MASFASSGAAMAATVQPSSSFFSQEKLCFKLDNNSYGSRNWRRSSSSSSSSPSVLRVTCRGLIDVALRELNNGKSVVDQVLQPPKPAPVAPLLKKSDFPAEFYFGAASSAFQIEGARNVDGRRDCIWDTFCDKFPDKIAEKSNANIACGSYERYKEDVALLSNIGANSYRFSISWSRILPTGSLKDGKNPKGIAYYNNLINELISKGITPFVTLFHWDVPQDLEDEYNGFRDKRIVDDFADFAKVCFDEFGDRVKNWITANEPWTFATMAYGLGWHAPGRCSSFLGCPAGQSTVEPYVVAHNLILAHAAAANLYKSTYQAKQGGVIGITLSTYWFEPYDSSYNNQLAAQRNQDFMLGWFLDPIANGDYPFNMRAIVKDRVPFFSSTEQEQIKGSYDFIGLNYYTSNYSLAQQIVQDQNPLYSLQDSYSTMEAKGPNGYIGEPTSTDADAWVYNVPHGLKEVLLLLKNRYGNPPIFITENGVYELDDPTKSIEEAKKDPMRIKYIQDHLKAVKDAIKEKVNVKGYFAWSLLDNFEWSHGYTNRFGLHFVDYKTLNRYPKDSALWYKDFLNDGKDAKSSK